MVGPARECWFLFPALNNSITRLSHSRACSRATKMSKLGCLSSSSRQVALSDGRFWACVVGAASVRQQPAALPSTQRVVLLPSYQKHNNIVTPKRNSCFLLLLVVIAYNGQSQTSIFLSFLFSFFDRLWFAFHNSIVSHFFVPSCVRDLVFAVSSTVNKHVRVPPISCCCKFNSSHTHHTQLGALFSGYMCLFKAT